MKKLFLVLPIILALGVIVAWPVNPPYRTVDFLQIGDNETWASEGNHSIAGWGALEPDTHDGNWGGIATDTDTYTDNKVRVVWNNTEGDFFEDRGAEFTMTITKKCNPDVCNRQWLRADRLKIRYLDGIAHDDFIVLWKNPNGNWELMGVVVTDHADTSEKWKFADINLVDKIPPQYRIGGNRQLTFKIVATGNEWAHRSTYGQVAIDYIWLEQP